MAETVWCDGGTGPEGHPKIYLHLTQEGWVICPYCSRRFERKDT